jgi:hypothetical protein
MKPIDAKPAKLAGLPKWSLIWPASDALTDAPIPVAVPTMP